jgi:arginyl-tRNA synthetase
MLPEQKHQLALWIADAANELSTGAPALAALSAAQIELDRPKQDSHGDLACNLALQLAKPLKTNPRQLAERLAEGLRARDTLGLLAAVEIAGPGFINLRLSVAAQRQVITEVLRLSDQFGRNDRGQGVPVLVEFVSANPTGPLHVGHGRQGALGDSLSSLLDANGFKVTREFYYNDAGAQINNLALSVQARARGILPESEQFPVDGYRGSYISDIAEDFVTGKTVTADRVEAVTATGVIDDLDAIRQFAVAYLRREQDIDLQAFGVRFDNYFLESSLYQDGRVDAAVKTLVAAGKTFEEGGALWLRSTDYGDDKDRVMRKSDGGYTYFVPDVAYHLAKWQRGFGKVINVQGSDHHGTIARVRAGLQASNSEIPKQFPDYVLHKMVTVMKGGEEVKISKRAGSYVTLRDLIEWSGGLSDHSVGDHSLTAEQALLRGRDAVRFFLISRKADSEFVFDVDLALARSDDNPVYYVQYAHARICSVFAQAGFDSDAIMNPEYLADALLGADLTLLVAPREMALMASLAHYPERIVTACEELAPHSIAFYLKDLAAELHSYYNAERFLVDDGKLRLARLALLAATRQVLKNGLTLLGVSAPAKM